MSNKVACRTCWTVLAAWAKKATDTVHMSIIYLSYNILLILDRPSPTTLRVLKCMMFFLFVVLLILKGGSKYQ